MTTSVWDEPAPARHTMLKDGWVVNSHGHVHNGHVHGPMMGGATHAPVVKVL